MDNRRQSGLWNRNPQTGYYEQVAPPTQSAPSGPYQYYQPPPQHAKGRSFSERAADVNLDEDGMQRSDSKRQHDGLLASARAATGPSLSTQLAQTQHINSTDLPGSSHQQPFHIDADYVPVNLRSTTWSPAPMHQDAQQPQVQTSQPKPRQVSNASNTSAILRRDSVPDRSPLQHLESWSKEEKRARVQEAEKRARAKSISGTGQSSISRQGSGKSRVVSDGAARKPRHVREHSQHLSNNAPAVPWDGHVRPNKAPEAVQEQTTPQSPKSPFDGQRQAPAIANESRQKKTPSIANHPQPYHYPPDAPRGTNSPGDFASQQHRLSMDSSRFHGNEYGQRARNTGFTGAIAAASAGAGFAAADSAAQRGKAAYERRKSQVQADSYSDGTMGQLSPNENGETRSQRTEPTSPGAQVAMNQLHTDRMGPKRERRDNSFDGMADVLPPDQVENPKTESVRFAIPPQTAAGQQAAQQVRLGVDDDTSHGGHRRIRDMFHRDHRPKRSYQASTDPLEEWRDARVARLTLKDLEFENTVVTSAVASPVEDKKAAWWEKGHRRSGSSGTKQPAVDLAQFEGPYEEQANGFQPRLFLKCGPLLRFTGIHKQKSNRSQNEQATETEIWRGTILIVTEDSQSDLSSTPVLRLFAQPMDLLPQSSHKHNGVQESPELEDPVAGQAKLSRTGRALYVRPVQDLSGDLDLSREENPNGLYAAMRTPVLGPQSTVGPDGRTSTHVTIQNKSRIKNRDGEKAKRVREVKAIRLHSERGWTFWRFHVEVELGSRQHRVAYRINRGPAMAFWVPPKGETMNIMFHSCNGFSRSVDSSQFSGPDPLWRDVLNRHQSRPFHVMIGGGDQIYNDAVMDGAQIFKDWLNIKNPDHKYHADFTFAMQNELEQFYLERYAMWFSQGLFAMANSQIPMVNIWDDHDIIDGFGSYPHHYMRTPVFSGLGAVAHKYYLLFQHQSLITETTKDEPSWLLGDNPGPYISEVSRSVFLHLGRKIAFLGLDCRTERMWDEILCQRTYDIIFERCRREIIKGETNHLIVLLGVPIAYPRLNFLENILTSRAMEPIKALGRTGMLGGFVNKFDGGVEILDDLNDHWTAKHHKAERNWFIQELQNLAADKSVRVTILGGDVHLGAAGQFYTAKKHLISKDKDHRYMPNIISSAIVNTPPPNVMADVLNRRNKVHHLDDKTDEDMIPMFSHDVNGSKRNNMRLLPRRNYCTIREYHPGTTPPSTPPPERNTPISTQAVAQGINHGPHDRQFPPGSMKRTMSLGRGTANLVRRLSSSSRTRKRPIPPEHAKPYESLSQQSEVPQRANSISGPRPDDPYQQRPANGFHRRPTDLSEKAGRQTDDLDGREPGHIDLEGGLDISLNMEINQHDPSGMTVPYRLLVPALWYDGPSEQDPARFKSHRASLMDRLKSFRRREMPADGAGDAEDYSDQESRASSPRPAPRQISMAPPEETMGLTNTGRGAVRQSQRSDVASYYDNDDDDDYDDDDEDEYGHNNARSPKSAFHQGYNLNTPPIGLSQTQYQEQRPMRSVSARQAPSQMKGRGEVMNGQHQQLDHRRHVSAPVTANRNSTADEDFDDTSDNDIQSQVDDQPPTNYPPGVRRGSKAERFFGIGDGDATGLWGGENGTRRASLQLQRDAVGRSAPLSRTGSLRQKLGWKGWKS